MAENPFHSLVRILGGVVLMQGKLGHQVLGQLLIAGSHEVTIAGASLVIAATAREKNAVGQAVIRTLAPAAAIHMLTRREDQRLEAAQRQFERRVRELQNEQRSIEVRRAEVSSLHAKVKRHKDDVDRQEGQVTAQEVSLQTREDELKAVRRQLTRDVKTHEGSRRAHEDRVMTLENQRNDFEEENRQLRKQLEELSAKLRRQNTKRTVKAATQRPRPRKKKS